MAWEDGQARGGISRVRLRTIGKRNLMRGRFAVQLMDDGMSGPGLLEELAYASITCA